MFILFFEHYSSSHCCFLTIDCTLLSSNSFLPPLLNIKNPTIAHDFNDDVFKSFPNMPKIYPHWRKNMIMLLFFDNCLSWFFHLFDYYFYTCVLVVFSTICVAFVLLSFVLLQKIWSQYIFYISSSVFSHLQLQGPHCLPHIAGKVWWKERWKQFRE